MALTTLSEVYSFNGTYNSATAYTAKNNAVKMLIEDMAAASIAGLTYYDKVSPDVTTSAQTFSVTFTTTQGYFLKFEITTVTQNAAPMRFYFLAEDGTPVTYVNCPGVMQYANPIASVGAKLVRYFADGIYDIYALQVLSSADFYPLGAVYFENETSLTPDYAVCYWSNTTPFYDVKNKLAFTSLVPGEPDPTTGVCVMCDTPVFYDNVFIGTVKNAKCIGASEVSVPLATYRVGSDTYIALGSRTIYIKVT